MQPRSWVSPLSMLWIGFHLSWSLPWFRICWLLMETLPSLKSLRSQVCQFCFTCFNETHQKTAVNCHKSNEKLAAQTRLSIALMAISFTWLILCEIVFFLLDWPLSVCALFFWFNRYLPMKYIYVLYTYGNGKPVASYIINNFDAFGTSLLHWKRWGCHWFWTKMGWGLA